MVKKKCHLIHPNNIIQCCVMRQIAHNCSLLHFCRSHLWKFSQTELHIWQFFICFSKKVIISVAGCSEMEHMLLQLNETTVIMSKHFRRIHSSGQRSFSKNTSIITLAFTISPYLHSFQSSIRLKCWWTECEEKASPSLATVRKTVEGTTGSDFCVRNNNRKSYQQERNQG